MRRGALAILAALAVPASSCQTAVRAPPAAAAAASPAKLTVTYRDPANVFEILDNVSNWLPDKCDAQYREYWTQRFGVTASDEERFASYKQLRKRYFAQSEGSEGNLFGKAKPPDRLAEAFYDAPTVESALSKLAALMTAEDVELLKGFVDAYRPQLEPLLAESRAFAAIASGVETKLSTPRAAEFYASVARFYRVADQPRFTVLYVWWPPVENTTANSRNRFLLLKYNPAKHREAAERASDVVVHELTHYLSSHQPEAQQRALTKTFVARCDVTKEIPPLKIFEEPLAVVHQKMFVSLVEPERLDFAASWYGSDPWIGTFAKLIYGQVQQSHARGRQLDDELMTTMAKSCAQLKAVAGLLAK